MFSVPWADRIAINGESNGGLLPRACLTQHPELFRRGRRGGRGLRHAPLPPFTAALQAAQRAGAPILLRVGTSAGHCGGKPTAQAIAEAADRLAFIEGALGAAASG